MPVCRFKVNLVFLLLLFLPMKIKGAAQPKKNWRQVFKVVETENGKMGCARFFHLIHFKYTPFHLNGLTKLLAALCKNYFVLANLMPILFPHILALF